MKVEQLLEKLRCEFPNHTFDAVQVERPERFGIPSKIPQDEGKDYCKFVVDGKQTKIIYDGWFIEDLRMQTCRLDPEVEVVNVYIETLKVLFANGN